MSSSQDLHNYSDHLYRDKCSHLEKKIKEIVFLNAAYENEVQNMQIKLAREKADRNILLKRLLTHEKTSTSNDGSLKYNISNNNNTNSPSSNNKNNSINSTHNNINHNNVNNNNNNNNNHNNFVNSNNNSSLSSSISSIEENNKILSSMLSKKHSISNTNSGKVPPVPTLSSLNVSGKKKKISIETANNHY